MANQFIGQSPDMYDLQRKQALADMLMQQSLAPSQTQVVGRTAIAQSPFEGLSKLAQAYASQRLQQQAAEQRQGIQQQGIRDASKFAAALRGTPAVEAHALPADQQGPTNEAIAAKGPDLAQAMQIAMGSSNPMLNQAGGQLLSAQMSSALPKAPKWTPIEQYNPQTGKKEKWLIDENNPQNRMPLGGQEATPMAIGPGGQAYDPLSIKPGAVLADPNKPFAVGPNGPAPNLAYQQYELSKANAGANNTQVNVNSFTPASEEAQKRFMQGVETRYSALQSAPAMLNNLERAKALAAQPNAFVGSFGDKKMSVAQFFNNNFGTSIAPEAIKNASELQSRLFVSVMENLKKMDASPSQYQQQVMQDAFGKITTDPKALPAILDVFGGLIKDKVAIHNKEVQDAERKGVKFPFNPVIQLQQNASQPGTLKFDAQGNPVP